MKKFVIIGICVLLVAIILIVCNLPQGETVNISSIHISSSTVRLESDMSKRLSVTVYPEKADQSSYELISENEFVALCEGDRVTAVNEGETYVHAESENGKVQSNKVKVVVSNSLFDTAAKILMLSENASEEELNEVKEVEITPQRASQIAEKEIAQVPEKFETPLVTEENAEDIVYVTKAGGRFHLKTCTYADGATPVSRQSAVAEGKTPCKKCIK